jgi:NTE family protein
MTPPPSKSRRPAAPAEVVALVLQGGGALGSYQAGVYEALDAAGLKLNWIAGISIGAINGALIAGNPPETAVARLREFWELVSSRNAAYPWFEDMARTIWEPLSGSGTVSFGAPGFFSPRSLPPFTQQAGTAAALSYYDTSELERTLVRLVDFDRINDGPIRLSVGAVNIRSGNFAYFDSAKMRIGPKHIMASGALPPGLPPIEIDGESYWDGGLVSNTPLQYVIDEDGYDRLLAFQVDLFSARGPMPRTLLEASEREKDIRYSSRTRLNTDVLKRRELIAAAARRLADRLPEALRDDPDLAFLTGQSSMSALTLVHLIYKGKHASGFAKDYEFSRSTIEQHWKAGKADMTRSLLDPDWINRRGASAGTIQILDLLDGKASPEAAEGSTP